MRKVHANKGPIAAISYSPNGKQIAFIGDDYRFKFNTPLEVWLLELGSGRVSNVSHELDRGARNAIVTDVSMEDSGVPPLWKGDEEITFVATDRGRCNIYSANVRTGKVNAVCSGDHVSHQSIDCQKRNNGVRKDGPCAFARTLHSG